RKEEKTLWAAISANRPLFEENGIGGPEGFAIHFTVMNDGKETVDPELSSSQFLINGIPLREWSVTIRRGPRNDQWRALPPGGYLFFTVALGTHFAQPGDYKVAWKGKAFRTPEFVFRVVPMAPKQVSP